MVPDRGRREHEPLSAGTRVGPYVLKALLEADGMACVYRARAPRLVRDVALRLLPPDAAVGAGFERDAKALAALSHPNLVAILDVGEEGGRRFLVSELLEGKTLRAALVDRAFSVRRAIEI